MLLKLLSKFEDAFRRAKSSYLRLAPIFILSPPRSGSTLLFETMFNFTELLYLPFESDYVWWQLFPYSRTDDPSDLVRGDEYSRKGREEYIKLYLDGINTSAISSSKLLKMQDCIKFNQELRVLDKTVANCFHLEYLVKAFPNAQFIFLFRDPRDNISSMIEGWQFVDRFGKVQLSPYLLKHKNAKISHWTYPAPPGWQRVVHRPLEEICAWSWQQHVERILDFQRRLNSRQYIVVKYEEIVASAEQTYENIANQFRLSVPAELYEAIKNPKFSFTTVSAPKRDKWKVNNNDKITSILPIIRKTSERIGYQL